MLGSQAIGGATLESYLLARHRAIDALLERAIEAGEVSQVIEVAAGLSPRGWRFTRRYGERLAYVEADLPGMAERKRAALERIGSLGERHRVSEVDVLRGDDGPGGLPRSRPSSTAARASRSSPRACSDTSPATRWSRSGGGLRLRWASSLPAATSPTCISAARSRRQVRAFRVVLSAFVRGRVYLHFSDAPGAERALLTAGFADAHVRPAVDVIGRRDGRGSRLANILEASTTLPPEASTT